MESAAPPLVSPSNFVRMTPSIPICSLKFVATLTASWPVIASTVKIVYVTAIFSLICFNSSIMASSTWRRPAVSKNTICMLFFAACSTAAFAISTGAFWFPMVKTGTPCFSPLISNCLMAAGRYTSQAVRRHFFPRSLYLPASLATVVVLPAPWRPHIIITVTSLDGRSFISVVSEPISLSISSLTILITICPGLRPFKTSSPTARSLTALINCFTTLKLTSASNSARLTSFIASLTSASVNEPLLRSFLNAFCNLSDKLSNAIHYLLAAIKHLFQ